MEVLREELNDQMRCWHSELELIDDREIKAAIEEMLKTMSKLFDLLED